MISVSNVTMRYGAKVLFDEVSTSFTPGKRYGLTGPNGAGKSTFMKLLTGEQPPQRGTVTRPAKVGVLRQDQFAFDQFRVIDTVIMGNHKLWSALQERELLYAKSDLTEAEGMRLGELEGIVGDEDGYEAEANAAILLQGLDIPDALHHRTDTSVGFVTTKAVIGDCGRRRRAGGGPCRREACGRSRGPRR